MSLSNPKAWAVCLAQMLRAQKGVSRRLSLIKIVLVVQFSVYGSLSHFCFSNKN